MSRNIPFFNYPSLFTEHEDKLLDIFKTVSSKGAFILQSELEQFESKLRSHCNVYDAIGVGNATDALQMLMMAGGIGLGDEVIFCSHTMVATASAIHFTGAKPIPIEVADDHLIDIDAIEGAITDKTRAICPTQLNGRVANMDRIIEISERYNLQIYEDSAQALGAKFKDQFAGSFGMGGCISFYPAKILGCFGDGGAILCNDSDVANRIRLMRDHGRDEDGDIPIWGFNSRLDNLQAAFLNYFFDDYQNTIDRRRELAEHYNSCLKEVNEVVLPEPPSENIDHFDVFQNYEIQANHRDQLKLFLQEKGIGTLIQWGGIPVHKFKKLGFDQNLPKTEELFERFLMLPLNLSLTDSDVEYVCSQIKKFYS